MSRSAPKKPYKPDRRLAVTLELGRLQHWHEVGLALQVAVERGLVDTGFLDGVEGRRTVADVLHDAVKERLAELGRATELYGFGDGDGH